MLIKLNTKQDWAFYSPATEILYGGAAGGGKSYYLRVSAIRWASEIPGIQIYLFRRTYPDLRENHLRGPTNFIILLKSLIDSGDVVYSKTENEFTWIKTGSRIALRHCQYDDDVYNYQGAEIHILLMDELTHFTDFIYRFLRARVRQSGLFIPDKYKQMIPRIEMGSNPGNIGHAWVKNAFIKQPFKIWKTEPHDGGLMRQFIPANYQDNPDLMASDPNYEYRLEGLGSEALVKAMKTGDWDIVAGAYFEHFSQRVHVLDEDFQILPHWPRFFAYDHGYNHPFSFGAYAVDDDGVVYKYLEIFRNKMGVADIMALIKSYCPEVKDKPIYAGHDCWARMKDGGDTIANQFYDNGRGLRLVKANIDRIQGASILREYVGNETSKRPRIYFKRSCTATIAQLSTAQIDPDRPEDILKVNASETDIYSGDDALEETRYAIRSHFRPADKQDMRFKHLDTASQHFHKAREKILKQALRTDDDFSSISEVFDQA